MNQNSREAIIELLFLSLYLDNHLSIAEDSALETALQSLGWESEKPKDIFLLTAFEHARKAICSDEATSAYIDRHVATIRKDGQHSAAFEWLGKVLASDGLAPPEEQFLNLLHYRLFAAS